jgi:hypothetical protein
VNGKLVLDQGNHTGALPGQVLRGPGYKKNPGSPTSSAALNRPVRQTANAQ